MFQCPGFTGDIFFFLAISPELELDNSASSWGPSITSSTFWIPSVFRAWKFFSLHLTCRHVLHISKQLLESEVIGSKQPGNIVLMLET